MTFSCSDPKRQKAYDDAHRELRLLLSAHLPLEAFTEALRMHDQLLALVLEAPSSINEAVQRFTDDPPPTLEQPVIARAREAREARFAPDPTAERPDLLALIREAIDMRMPDWSPETDDEIATTIGRDLGIDSEEIDAQLHGTYMGREIIRTYGLDRIILNVGPPPFDMGATEEPGDDL